MPVVAGSADASQPAPPFDLRVALLLRLRVDHRVNAVSPGTPFFRRASLTCRKAARKKSRSSCCWPILRCFDPALPGAVATRRRRSRPLVERLGRVRRTPHRVQRFGPAEPDLAPP